MIIYHAGNFVFLSDKEKERELKERNVKAYGAHDRLVSFFFKKETDNIIALAKEETDAPQEA